MAALMTNGGDVYDYMEVVGKGLSIKNKPVPLIAVPTTSGTGSECTKNAVLKSTEHGKKASMRHDTMLPSIAVIDPCLSVSCPQQVCYAYSNSPSSPPFSFSSPSLPFSYPSFSHSFPSPSPPFPSPSLPFPFPPPPFPSPVPL